MGRNGSQGVYEDDPTVMTLEELLEHGRALERVEPRRSP